MSKEDVGSFMDAHEDLMYGSLSDESEVKDNQAAPTGDAPATESPSQADKPASDPATEGNAEEKKEQPGKTEPAAEASKESVEEQPTDKPEDDDPEVDIGNGEKVRLSELKQGYLRRSDYSRKTQEVARVKEEADKAREETSKLVSDITADDDMKEFLRAHPEALSHLLERPEATRALLGNSQLINDFWEDYETLQKNPRLAERLTAESPESQEALRAHQTRERINAIAASLDNAVSIVAEQFPGIDAAQVEDYLMELGGFNREADPQATAAGFGRLYNLLFVNTNEGVKIDAKLIRDRFEFLSATSKSKEQREQDDADTHNAEVDAELKREQDAPPATPTGGAPIAEAEKGKSFERFEDHLQDLLYGGE